MSRTNLIQHLNELVGALALDEQFKQDFLQDRLRAIKRFNEEFAPRYRQKPLELSGDELRLITAINSASIEEFIAILAIIITGSASTNSRYAYKRPSSS